MHSSGVCTHNISSDQNNTCYRYVENGSLANIVKKFGKFPESLVCVYITQVLEGLVYLHEQGVVHRDIKGANILTTKEGVIKLADFGVATKFGDEKDATVVGTPVCIAFIFILAVQLILSTKEYSLIINLLVLDGTRDN